MVSPRISDSTAVFLFWRPIGCQTSHSLPGCLTIFVETYEYPPRLRIRVMASKLSRNERKDIYIYIYSNDIL